MLIIHAVRDLFPWIIQLERRLLDGGNKGGMAHQTVQFCHAVSAAR